MSKSANSTIITLGVVGVILFFVWRIFGQRTQAVRAQTAYTGAGGVSYQQTPYGTSVQANPGSILSSIMGALTGKTGTNKPTQAQGAYQAKSSPMSFGVGSGSNTSTNTASQNGFLQSFLNFTNRDRGNIQTTPDYGMTGYQIPEEPLTLFPLSGVDMSNGGWTAPDTGGTYLNDYQLAYEPTQQFDLSGVDMSTSTEAYNPDWIGSYMGNDDYQEGPWTQVDDSGIWFGEGW